MKRIFCISAAAVLLAGLLCACGSSPAASDTEDSAAPSPPAAEIQDPVSEQTEAPVSGTEASETVPSESAGSTEDPAETASAEDTAEEPEDAEQLERTLWYSPDPETDEALTQTTILVPDDSPEALAAALCSAGVLSQDVTLNSAVFDTIADESTLVLDFSQSLDEQLNTCDDRQASLLIASITDTFLTAYPEASQVLLTVNGSMLDVPEQDADPLQHWSDGEPAADPETPAPTESSELTTVQLSSIDASISYDSSTFELSEGDRSVLVSPIQGDSCSLSIEVSQTDSGSLTDSLLSETGATENHVFLAGGNLPAVQLSVPTEDGSDLEYFIVTSDEGTCLLTISCDPDAVDSMVPELVDILNSFTLVP